VRVHVGGVTVDAVAAIVQSMRSIRVTPAALSNLRDRLRRPNPVPRDQRPPLSSLFMKQSSVRNHPSP
jgi:hypothetical protein